MSATSDLRPRPGHRHATRGRPLRPGEDGLQGDGLGPQVLALPVPVRHRLLRHGVHGRGGGPRYDVDRFGAALPRFSPRQADVLMVVGTISEQAGPDPQADLRRRWPSPSGWWPSASAPRRGGFYDNYATVQGIDPIIPVDVYIPGCPPRPETVLDGLIMLQEKIQDQPHKLIDREKPALPAKG